MAEFTCPSCGSHRLEEVMTGVTVASTVNSFEIDEDEISIDYGEQSNEDGMVERYQCKECGHVVANSQEELIDFLS